MKLDVINQQSYYYQLDQMSGCYCKLCCVCVCVCVCVFHLRPSGSIVEHKQADKDNNKVAHNRLGTVRATSLDQFKGLN